MALTKQTMTGEQRTSVAIEYLKAFDDGGVTLNSITHHFSEFNWIFSGSDLLDAEGTSRGEHRDGPRRSGGAADQRSNREPWGLPGSTMSTSRTSPPTSGTRPVR